MESWVLRHWNVFFLLTFALLTQSAWSQRVGPTSSKRWSHGQEGISVATVARNLSRPPKNTGSPLTPGQPGNFRLGPIDTPALFVGDFSFRLQVPGNASRVTFTLRPVNPAVDLDLFVRFGQDNDLRDGMVVTDYASVGLTGNEEIIITRVSNPPLRGGTYFVSLALYDTGVVTEGTVTAQVETVGEDTLPSHTEAGTITTVAGTGRSGYNGDGGAATAAQLLVPTSVAMDGVGNLYIADTGNSRIRKVDITGIITTVAGTGEPGFSGDDGAATEVQLSVPEGVAVDGAGNLYIADTGNSRIRKVDSTGVITTVAGGGGASLGVGVPAIQAQLFSPRDVTVDRDSNLYIADNVILKIDSAGIITTVTGTIEIYGGGHSALGLGFPTGMAMDGAGNLYVASTGHRVIRKIDPAGIVTTVAGIYEPHVFGWGGFSGDGGPATEARLSVPEGVAVDGAGNLYIADTGNSRIRKVDSAGIITTVAGTEESGFSGDGGPAVQARLYEPRGMATDGAGNLYIADTVNHRIRRLTTIPEGAPLISSGGIVLATGTPVLKRISPNSLISVFGQNFAPEGIQALSPRLDAEGRVAANLAGTCLEIDGKRAPLFAVFTTQINAQAPHDLTPGQSRAVAIRGCDTEMEEQRGTVATVETVTVSPAFFSFQSNTDGRNPIIALHGGGPDLVGSPGAVPGVELTPAEPGEYISLFGTGFGTTEPQLETGQIPDGLARLANDVSFTFGGITVLQEDVFYAGAAPCCAGLYQFTMRVPLGFPDGHAPVVATVQGVSTPEGPYLTVRRRQ